MVLKAGLVIALVAIAGFAGWAAIAFFLRPGIRAQREYGGLTRIPVTGEVLDSGGRTSAKSGDTEYWATVRYRTASGADTDGPTMIDGGLFLIRSRTRPRVWTVWGHGLPRSWARW
jgi:hypothetical protein